MSFYMSSPSNNQSGKNRNPIESLYGKSLQNVFYDEICRIEKIVKALYLITDLFDDFDVLKRSIRETSISMLKAIHVPYEADLKDMSFRISLALSYIESLMSFIDVARASQKISPMNTQIVLRELRVFHIHLQSRHDTLREHIHHGFDPEEVSIASIFQAENQQPKQPSDYGISKTSEEIHQKTATRDLLPGPAQDSVESTVKTSSKNSQLTNPSYKAMKKAKEDRKGQILAIVKGMDKVTIKDIASRIVKCSEKTLQRDLSDLIKSGKIKKEGDRRWSTYTLGESQ